MEGDLVALEQFPDEFSGELARGYLEANGVPAFLRNGGAVGTGLGSVDATAAYVLLVRHEDRADAHQLLEVAAAERQGSE